jgi:hypothetical protein
MELHHEDSRIPLDRLRWTFHGRDVTCICCHGPIYLADPAAPLPRSGLCRICEAALAEDLRPSVKNG